MLLCFLFKLNFLLFIFLIFSKLLTDSNVFSPQFLKTKCPGFMTNAIKWNFTKFLVDRNGVPQKRYAPNFAPNDITPDLEAELAKPASE